MYPDASIFFWSGQSYSYIMRKVWYHQIWIQKYLVFIVSDLIYIRNASFWADNNQQINFWTKVSILPNSYFLCKSVASFHVWNLQRFLHKHRAAIQFSAPLDIRFAAKIRMAIMSMFQTSIYKFYMRGTRLFSSSIFDAISTTY